MLMNTHIKDDIPIRIVIRFQRFLLFPVSSNNETLKYLLYIDAQVYHSVVDQCKTVLYGLPCPAPMNFGLISQYWMNEHQPP